MYAIDFVRKRNPAAIVDHRREDTSWEREWQRIDAPLRRLDAVVGRFSRRHGWDLERAVRDWPATTLRQKSDDLQRIIQIYLEHPARLEYTVWVCALQDRGARRFVKAQSIVESQPIDVIEPQLGPTLRRASRLVMGWTEADLEFAVDVQSCSATSEEEALY